MSFKDGYLCFISIEQINFILGRSFSVWLVSIGYLTNEKKLIGFKKSNLWLLFYRSSPLIDLQGLTLKFICKVPSQVPLPSFRLLFAIYEYWRLFEIRGQKTPFDCQKCGTPASYFIFHISNIMLFEDQNNWISYHLKYLFPFLTQFSNGESDTLLYILIYLIVLVIMTLP